MTLVYGIEGSCQTLRRYFDAYVDNELDAEGTGHVLGHISLCSDCACVVRRRQHLKQRLKDAVMKQEVPPLLTAAVRARLRREK